MADEPPVTVKHVGPLTIYIQNGEAYVYICERDTTGTVTIPAEVDHVPVTRVGVGAFQFTAVERVVIPEGVTEIQTEAFSQCQSLTDVSVPLSLKRVEQDSLLLTPKEKTMHYPGTKQDWDKVINSQFVDLKMPWQRPVPTPTPAPTAKPEIKNPFKDVAKDQYYAAPVLWAVNHDPQITAGTTATTFSPENPCTRAQIVTFLYRDLK